jgi:hypothetical protein
MEAVTTLEDVQSIQTQGGNTRYVARDSDGNEYTTFREEIGKDAKKLQGKRVRITYHETQRGRYTNVYLDSIELASGQAPSDAGSDVQEAAWRTAVDAAPWLVGKPTGEVPPEQLYEKLKPFEEQVAADIEDGRRKSPPGE